ncbi:MAG: Plug domain-containing protein [Gammaproteobacteria bacterium]|nr:Plug domain-containing protein [Gammaproteobacteria bacterium]
MRSDEVAQPVTILSGEALARRLAPSLGETVDGQPGIHSSYFGPAVGRPVIRGLSGPRVKVLEDGIAAMDASTTSGDHATSVEPFLADRIEILKGPATVLYGSGAIGGVVNAVSGRVPDVVPDAPLEIRAEVRAGDVADERSAAFRADGGGGASPGTWMRLTRHTDEFEIPGRAEPDALRQAEAAEADHDEEHEEDALRRAAEFRSGYRVVLLRPRLDRRRRADRLRGQSLRDGLRAARWPWAWRGARRRTRGRARGRGRGRRCPHRARPDPSRSPARLDRALQGNRRAAFPRCLETTTGTRRSRATARSAPASTTKPSRVVWNC